MMVVVKCLFRPTGEIKSMRRRRRNTERIEITCERKRATEWREITWTLVLLYY